MVPAIFLVEFYIQHAEKIQNLAVSKNGCNVNSMFLTGVFTAKKDAC